jgi:hypothetical protein
MTESYDAAWAPGPFGLRNTGVICHFNALLQAIAACTAVLRAALGAREYLGRTATGRAFYDFALAAAPAAARPPGCAPFGGAAPLESMSAALLRALVGDLRSRRPGFRYGPGQESASEGLVLLLDMLDDPRAAAGEENPVARLFYHRSLASVYCRACRKAASEATDVAVQFNLFHYDDAVAAGLDAAGPEAFGDLLRSYAAPLDDYRCEACGARGGGVRHDQLRMVPEVLVVAFNLYGRRRLRPFPPRVVFPGAAGGRLEYRQVAQVEQTGSLAGGHYTARALRAGGAVYAMNDAAFAPAAFGASPNVYLVFYHHAAEKE